ncbi:MAG: hypothetical protein ACKN9V_04605 [Pseudomonadota bacterium]
MKKFFGSLVLVTALVLSACGRDDQGGQQPPPYQPTGPVVEQPADDYGTGGGYAGGYCGLLCRWRMRRQQRWGGGCY